MVDRQYTFKEVEKKIVPLFRSQIVLMNKMAQSVSRDYIARDKLFPYRELCFGYLLIGRKNAEATLHLIKANLVHQVHYISRNTFEMMVTLYYIDNDKSKRDELTQRYFDYQGVKAHQAMKLMTDYPEPFIGIRTEENDKEVEQNYNVFIAKYTQGGKKPDLSTWSGKKLDKMIDSLTNKELKNDILRRYRIMVSMNNNFLHPTIQYLKQSILEYLKVEIDYKVRIMQLHSITTTMDLIIQKFLEHFPKGRPAFRKQLSDINDGDNAIMNSARDAGLFDT